MINRLLGVHSDVLIIGAGMSGLAAGVRAALAGKRVRVLERHAVWGGLNSFYKKGGHHFDVGLHAVTNWMPPGYKGPRIPLQRLCRQLRISYEELQLDPQTQSSVRFPGMTLRFSNGLGLLTEQIAQHFPTQVDGFLRLAQRTESYPESVHQTPFVSARQVLGEYLSSPLLVEMLLCPLLYYGAASLDDVDFEQFTILFNSIYREGFCRPRGGVRHLLDLLLGRLESLGGELVRKTEVQSLEVENNRVTAVHTQRGTYRAPVVISSAGKVETLALRSDTQTQDHQAEAGQLGFVENLWVLSQDPARLGFSDCICFFSQNERFTWRPPAAPVSLESGVICVPSNYQHQPPLERYVIRATHLAQPKFWLTAEEPVYQAQKVEWTQQSAATVATYGAPFSPYVRYTDGFTPRTVRKYTGHVNGAIYGAPEKIKSGRTSLDNLFLCGTDQGLLGIVGAMLSGIAVVNAYVVREP